jgi:5-methylthioadenosine/S-adenosylhomocysteine deaminase
MWLRNATYLNQDMQFQTADLLIDEGGHIVEIVPPGSDHTAREAGEFDCSECLVLPGLVHAHFHSQASMLRGLNRKTPSEVQEALRTRAYEFLDEKASSEEFKTACVKDYVDLVHQGVTFCADLGTGDRDPQLYTDAMSEVGLRGIIDAYDNFETVGGVEGPENALQQFAVRLPEGEFSDETLTAAQKIKKRFDPIFLIHSVETALQGEDDGGEWEQSNLELFAEHGLLSSRAVVLQATNLTDVDIRILREHEASVVHCPVCSLPATAPLLELLENEINVAVGTDDERTDIWEAMRIAYFLLRDLDPGRRIKAEAILDMATINGARAYGMHNLIGKIAPGYRADLMFVEKDHLDLLPVVDQDAFSTRCHNLLMAGHSTIIKHVMVEGNWIMQDQRMVTVSEPHAHARYREMMAQIFERRP